MTRKYPAKGFTLLETIIYLGLLSALLAGLIVTTYPIFTNTANNMQTVTAEGEAAFILRKINFMLSDAWYVTLLTPQTLTVFRNPVVGGEELTIDFLSGKLRYEGERMINSRVEITDFKVTESFPPEGHLIEVEFKVDGTQVGPWKKYVHF